MRNFPRLVIAGTHSGAGKTSISTAILSLLLEDNVYVQPFKVGPDYIDTEFHSFVTKRPSYNLDSWMFTSNDILDVFMKHAPSEYGISIIEGVMGLFDGQGMNHVGSTAHLAEILSAPVILVVNAQGQSRSVAALVKGFLDFSSKTKVAGVILNRVSSQKHYEILKGSIEIYAGVNCYGYLKSDESLIIKSRHLGLMRPDDIINIKEIITRLLETAKTTIDIDGLKRLAHSVKPIDTENIHSLSSDNFKSPSQIKRLKPFNNKIRIGVARDKAFSFYYNDNLDALAELGAELVFFSPMKDELLPENLAGIYLGGGYPEVFASELCQNVKLRESIYKSLQNGLPAYAECGGMLYLCSEIEGSDKNRYKMVGFLPHHAKMNDRLQHFGYTCVTVLEDCFAGAAGHMFKAHEFHHSSIYLPHDISIQNTEYEHAFMVSKPQNIKDDNLEDDPASYNSNETWVCGIKYKNVLAGYPHIHFYANKQFANNFIKSCVDYKRLDGEF